MLRYDRLALLLVAASVLACPAALAAGADPTQWYDTMYAEGCGQFSFGAWPGCLDGYDGQSTIDYTQRPGAYIEAYRVNSPAWAGPTGFYSDDLGTPIPDGGSKTWSDIYLWAYNYTPQLDQVAVGCTWGGSGTKPPAGYTGILTLDYVPASLNWTGPTEFRFDLTKTSGAYLPCPITDDPFNPENVTRMHLTVYTTPEPSSLAALGLALAGFGAGAVRRRRR